MLENAGEMQSSDYGCCGVHGSAWIEKNSPWFEVVYEAVPLQPITCKIVKTSFYIHDMKNTSSNVIGFKEKTNRQQGYIPQNNDNGERCTSESRSRSRELRRPSSAENQRSNHNDMDRSPDRSCNRGNLDERSRPEHRSRQRVEGERHRSSHSNSREHSNNYLHLHWRDQSPVSERRASSSENRDKTDNHKSRQRSRSNMSRRKCLEHYRHSNSRERSSHSRKHESRDRRTRSKSRSRSKSRRRRSSQSTRRRSSEPQGHSYDISARRAQRDRLGRFQSRYSRAQSPSCRERRRQEENDRRGRSRSLLRSRSRIRSSHSRRRRSSVPDGRFQHIERHSRFNDHCDRDDSAASRERERNKRPQSPANVNIVVSPPPETALTVPNICDTIEEKAPEIKIHLCFYPKSTTNLETATSEPGIVFINGKKVISLSTIDLSKEGYIFQPIDITKNCHPTTNQLTIVPLFSGNADLQDYYYSVSVVKVIPGQQLCERLVKTRMFHPDHTRRLVKDQLDIGKDFEVSATRVRASLVCPVGMTKLRYPCRGEACRHIQCVDALTVISLNTNKPQWPCQVCSEPTSYENLIIDGLFMEILQNVPETVTEVEFWADGSWNYIEMNPPVGKLDKKDISIIELDLSRTLESIDLTETEDEKTPVTKKRKVEMPLKPILKNSTNRLATDDEYAPFWRV